MLRFRGFTIDNAPPWSKALLSVKIIVSIGPA